MDLSGIRQLSKYIAVKELHAEYGYPIRKMCAKLCIAASSYYKWLKRKPSKRQLENEDLTDKIKDMFYENDCVLGVRRMTGYINRKYNTKYTHKRIRRLMRMSGLYSVIRRQRHSCTVRSPKEQAAENILNRDFKAYNINEKWLTDVSEFKYGTGNKAYLSAILDLGDNSIVAWVLGHSNNNQLVFETFNAAVAARPDAHPLFHSDRGFQYTSPVFVRKLQEAGMTRSMSRVGKCIDNGPMEGFWSIIKTEMYYLNHFDTYEELKAAIAKYMYHYNNTRYQEKLGFLSPMEYQSKLLAA